LGRTRLVDEVTIRLRNLILDGVLPPGKPLLQLDLCEQLGVSRTPLREAFRILENEGYVRVSNGNKTLEVIDLSVEDMQELYAFREVVDGLAARLAAQRGVTPTELDELRAMTEAMDETAPGASRTLSHADFHARIAELSANKYAIGQIPMIRLTAQMMARRVRTLVELAPEHSAELLEEGTDDHRGVVAAIEARDGRLAEAIARRHLRKTMRSALLQS
jgi:DNA-binding GntR family transcriptional regulator